MPVPHRRLSRVETVAAHLIQRGHISEGSALVEYGRFRLADVIHRLRNERADLLPKGHVIVTLHKHDTQGNAYGEYHLVPKKAEAIRRIVDAAREREAAKTKAELSERDHAGVRGGAGSGGRPSAPRHWYADPSNALMVRAAG